MNWYKKAYLCILGKQDAPDMGKDARFFWEAIRLKNGETVYDTSAGNHWRLYALASRYIGGIENIESIGFLDGMGTYTVKVKGDEAKSYFDKTYFSGQ